MDPGCGARGGVADHVPDAQSSVCLRGRSRGRRGKRALILRLGRAVQLRQLHVLTGLEAEEESVRTQSLNSTIGVAEALPKAGGAVS